MYVNWSIMKKADKSKSRVAVDKWVVSEEPHADGASHYHACIATNGQMVTTKEMDGE